MRRGTNPMHRRPPSRTQRYRRAAWTIGLAASILAGLLSLVATVAAASSTATWVYLSDRAALVYCPIRLDSSPKSGYGGPYIHSNASHACAGVVKVERTPAGDLRIHNDPVGAIGACIIGADETTARLDLSMGGSGCGEVTTVPFYRNGAHVRIQDINDGLANVWLLEVYDPP